MKKLSLVLCIFLMISCNRVERLRIVLDSYKGYQEAQLYQNFGAFQRSYLSGNNKIVEYHEKVENFHINPNANLNTNTANNNQPFFNSNNRANSQNINFGLGSVQGQYTSSECLLRFTIDPRNIVQTWSYDGSLCHNYATRENINPNYLRDLAVATEQSYGLTLKSSRKGAKIVDIYPGSSAYKQGLRKGDLLTRINDLDLAGLAKEFAYNELNSKNQSRIIALRKETDLDILVSKSQTPLLYSYPKSTKKFLGFKN